MAIEKYTVSFTLERDNANDNDDQWYDEEYIATQMSAWLYRGANSSTSELYEWIAYSDYNVTDITVNNTKFIKLNWAKEDTNV